MFVLNLLYYVDYPCIYGASHYSFARLFIAVSRQLYQGRVFHDAWFTDRLEPGNHTHICQSTGAVHHSSPTQIHRLRCCRRIRGGICWVSVLVTNLRWTCQCAILASLQMFIYTKPHSKITRGWLINLSILRFYWWMDMSPRGHGICTCYVAKYLAQWHADGNASLCQYLLKPHLCMFVFRGAQMWCISD